MTEWAFSRAPSSITHHSSLAEVGLQPRFLATKSTPTPSACRSYDHIENVVAVSAITHVGQ